MRKYFTCILLAVLICILSLTPVLAADAYSPDKIVDEADLLTSAEESKLRERAADVIGKYDCDIVIITVSSLEGISAESAADDCFDYIGYGIGSDRSGILLLVSIGDREWHMSTSGRAIQVFTDYGLDYIGDTVSDSLGDGDYFEAFEDFIKLCDDFLNEYETSGRAYDTNHKLKERRSLSGYIFLAVISLGAGALIAFAATSSMKNKLKTVRPQNMANAYAENGGVNFTVSKDIFLYRTVRRTPRPKDNYGSRGGGSRMHTSSSGRSHGGRSGKF